MGYENYFSLKIQGEVTKSVTFCPNCKIQVDGKFCNICGSPLDIIQAPVDKKEIITELRKSSDDCSFVLEDTGKCREPGSGYDVSDDIQKFSKKYPSLMFQLDIEWDESGTDRYFFKNGVKQDAKAKVIYNEPTFD